MLFLLESFKHLRTRTDLPAANRLHRPLGVLLSMTVASGIALADLPEGPGKAATVRVCGKCHSPERAASLHQSHSNWEETIFKMVKLGAQGSDEEFEAVLSYLSKNFGLETPGPINLNTANEVDLQTSLLLLRSQAKAIIAYRTRNGGLRSMADLQNIPGLDMQKIEAKKARIVF